MPRNNCWYRRVPVLATTNEWYAKNRVGGGGGGGTPWLLIDTFTGADGTLLHGTACDTGQIRLAEYGTAQLLSNTAHLAPSGPSLVKYTTGTIPTKITVTEYNNNHFTDIYFHYDGNNGGTKGYIIRQYRTTTQIIKRSVGFMAYTTGNISFVHVSPWTVTLDIVANGFTQTTTSANGTNVVTYTEPGMPDQSELYVGIGSNGGQFDSLYIR